MGKWSNLTCRIFFRRVGSTSSYCWWKNSCTTWDVSNPCKYWDKLPTSTGATARFQPSPTRKTSWEPYGEKPLEAEASTFKQQLPRPWKLCKPKMLSWSVPWRDMGPGPFFNGRKEMRKWIKIRWNWSFFGFPDLKLEIPIDLHLLGT